jgi:DNA polymerase-1
VIAGDERLHDGFMKMLRYRKRHTYQTLFVNVFRQHQVDGRIHAQYNQLIRTGRMSSKKPNDQQNTYDSKELVLPDSDDDAFLEADGRQIEFRLIAHYANDAEVIEAYRNDPDTDFHEWVKDLVGISREPAKTVNFTIAYGGGKARVVEGLSSNMELVGSLGAQVDELIASGRVDPSQRAEAFAALCKMRGAVVYDSYHARMPGIRRVTRYAATQAKTTGYVFSASGRVRMLPEHASWRALNSVTQGLGSDIVKIGMVATSPRYNELVRRNGIEIRKNVHDAIVYHGPREALYDPSIQSYLLSRLETLPFQLRVPIRFEMGVSSESWAKASKGVKLDMKSLRTTVEELVTT